MGMVWSAWLSCTSASIHVALRCLSAVCCHPPPAACCCSKAGEVSSLEGRKRTLEAGMAERRSEVEMQLELMQARGLGAAAREV